LTYWLIVDIGIAFNAFTAVLIVACPCALALAIPFSYGNILRILGKHSFYLKNVQVIDRIQEITEVIFDKTGTITDHKRMMVSLVNKDILAHEKYLIKSATFQSNHPVSKAIFQFMSGSYTSDVDEFSEYIGQGIEVCILNDHVRIGSSDYINSTKSSSKSGVYVEINGKTITSFRVENSYREGVETLVKSLATRYKVSILSGDNNREAERLRQFFPKNATMIFDQSPLEKLNYIKSRQSLGHKILMIGDGLNDAGALKQSEVGLVISDDSNNFTPACDGILNAKYFESLLNFLLFLKQSRWIIVGAFGLAFFYNMIGLFFAVRGELSPIIAAILMPVSSITVMIYGLISSKLLFERYQ
jgi:Cu+-exporting ATPase